MQLRILAPAIVLAMFATDCVARFAFPPARVAFRGWEAATVLADGEGYFAPNLNYRNNHIFGESANMANRPDLRVYRREVWTDDAWGYRNSVERPDLPVRVVLAGDSYAVGENLRDDETLTSQLFLLSGVRCKNAGFLGFGPATWENMQPLMKRLGMKGGLVIYEQSERMVVPDPPEGPSYQAGAAFRMLHRVFGMELKTYQGTRRLLINRPLQYYAYSPLKIVLARGLRSMEDDFWLPRIGSPRIFSANLRGGQPMLFLTTEPQNFAHARPASAAFYADLQARVRASGNELLVIFVPDKYNVYFPLLENPGQTPSEAGLFLRNLGDNLRKAGVPYVDLTPALRQQAAQGLATGAYNYFLDDSHWGPFGTRRAAEEIMKSEQFQAVVRSQ
jgi:hypothetical protein